ncbi:MAG: histidine kinase [Hirschia sp.]|nr:histidine kinase [Hirschia sp.]MBF18244.1 histidine kinase [Hirschia sp.]
MPEENTARRSTRLNGSHDMSGARIAWIMLCCAAAFLAWISGIAPHIAGLILIACAPVVLGLIGEAVSANGADEIEITAWTLTATAATAMTGGANSSLCVLFFLPVATALARGRSRLAIEAVVFSLLGFSFSALFVAFGHSGLIPDEYAPAPAFLTGAAIIYFAALIIRWRWRSVAQRKALIDDVDAAMRARAGMEKRWRDARRDVNALKKSMEARTSFFAQTSHELRTPLNAILGFSEAMKTGLFGPLPERYQEYAGLIHEGGQSLQVIVDDVLDLSKIEAGRYEISPIEISLSDIVEEAVRFMGDQARRSDVSLKMLRPDQDVAAFADPRAVRQVTLNLLSNAIKYTPRGGQVEVRVQQGDKAAQLSVRDTGSGMDQALFQALKRPFEQAGTASQQRAGPKGTGLGLTISDAFMNLHGGQLILVENPGSGSEIVATFPNEGH